MTLRDLLANKPIKATRNVATDKPNNQNIRRGVPFPTTDRNGTPLSFNSSSSNNNNFQIIDPSKAIKSSSDLFSREALNWINGSLTAYGSPYTENQLLGAYMSSVYMYAALRRVSNLISRVKIVAEIRDGERYVRAPESNKINQIFERDGAETLSRMWLNYAIYGATMIYKVPTRRAISESAVGNIITAYRDGAVDGLYVVDKPQWELDDAGQYGEIQGFHVNQYHSEDGVLKEKHYIERAESIYYTDWNPHDPNRGQSLVSVCIHEAVASAAIAQWMSEYFTRGAMPLILVTMEDDPALLTDADLLKYKRRFEQYWSGMSSSLRSMFMDRKVNVEQIGINADEVAAPDLMETALEGISATVGLDRELIVTPSGGSQERHALLIKRAWEDTVIPIAEKFVQRIEKDLGLPNGMRLVLDLSHVSELEADREEKSGTEISIYESGLQTYNETRTRLNMPPVKEMEGWYYHDGKPKSLETIIAETSLPSESLRDYVFQLWSEDLAKRSEVLAMLGRNLPSNERDGYRSDLEGAYDFVQGLWGDDLLTRHQVLQLLGYEMPEEADDGYRSELERGSDYGDWIVGLWSDNLLTRSQTIELLDMGLSLPQEAPDGYADEIGDRRSNVMDLWGDNLLKRSQVFERLGITPPDDFIDGYIDEVENEIEANSEEKQNEIDKIMDLWGDNLLTRSQVLKLLNIEIPDNFIDGYMDEVEGKTEKYLESETVKRENAIELWGENLLKRRDVAKELGIPEYDDYPDGFQSEIETIMDALSDKKAEALTADPENPDDDGSGGGGGNFRMATRGAEDDWIERQSDPASQTPYESDMVDTISEWLLPTSDIGEMKPYDWDTDETGKPIHDYPYYENSAVYSDNPLNYDTDDMDSVIRGYTADKNAQSTFFNDTLIDKFMEFVENEMRNPNRNRSDTSSHVVITPVYGENKDTDSTYIVLSLNNHPLISDIYHNIKDVVGERNGIRWVSPENFHITLAYSDKGNAKQLRGAVSESDSPLIRLVAVNTFDNDDETVVKIQIEKTPELVQLQERIVGNLMSSGVDVSEYHQLGNFEPHITLFYAPANFTWIPIELDFEIHPDSILIQQSEYETVYRVNLHTDDKHNEPDGTLTEHSDYFAKENEQRLREMMRKSKREIFLRWLQKRDMFGRELSFSDLPDKVQYALTLYAGDEVDRDTVTPKMRKAVLHCIESGQMDSDSDAINPLQSAIDEIKAKQDDVVSELKAWRKATLRNINKGMRFETFHIDDDEAQEIKSQIAEMSGDDNNIKNLFGRLISEHGESNE